MCWCRKMYGKPQNISYIPLFSYFHYILCPFRKQCQLKWVANISIIKCKWIFYDLDKMLTYIDANIFSVHQCLTTLDAKLKEFKALEFSYIGWLLWTALILLSPKCYFLHLKWIHSLTASTMKWLHSLIMKWSRCTAWTISKREQFIYIPSENRWNQMNVSLQIHYIVPWKLVGKDCCRMIIRYLFCSIGYQWRYCLRAGRSNSIYRYCLRTSRINSIHMYCLSAYMSMNINIGIAWCLVEAVVPVDTVWGLVWAIVSICIVSALVGK